MKSRPFFLLLLTLIITARISAQQVQWLQTITGVTPGYRMELEAVSDKAGYLYVIGEYRDSAYFGKGFLKAPAKNTGYLMMAKYDTLGNVLWKKTLDAKTISRKWKYNNLKVQIGALGYIYITADLDTVYREYYNLGHKAASLMKVDTSGEILWEKTMSATGLMGLDDEENIYLTGDFYDTCCFNPDACFLVEGGPYLFLTKLSTHGKVLWGRVIGAGMYEWRMTVSRSGKVYASYHISSPGSWWADTTHNLPREGRFFMAAFDQEGRTEWIIPGPGNHANATGLQTDSNGFIYICGSTDSITSFGQHRIGIANDYSYMAKLDSNGKVIWVRNSGTYCKPGEPCNGINVSDEGLVTDGGGTSYMLGFSKRVGVKAGNVELPTNGAYLVVYDTNGELIKANSIFTKDVIYNIIKGGAHVYIYTTYDRAKVGSHILRARKKEAWDFMIMKIR